MLSVIIVLLLIIPMNLLARKTNLPALIWYLLAGVLLGPYVFKVIEFTKGSIIRDAALIIIMLRSGLGLSLSSLKENGLPAVLLSFLPGVIEAIVIMLGSVYLFDFSYLQGIIVGFMLAAVSPAIVVPAMLKLQKKKLGKNIPSLILASSALDDVVALSMFTFFTSLYFDQATSLVLSVVMIPIKMIVSIGLGYCMAYLLGKIKKINSFLIVGIAIMSVIFEDQLPISALLLILAMGLSFREHHQESAIQLEVVLEKCWNIAQVFLFVSVGTELNIFGLSDLWLPGSILIIAGLIFRSLGVFLSTITLTFKNRMYTMIAYLPKATVQAALASVPLSMGIAQGKEMLVLAVLAIVITTPVGSILMEYLAPYLLEKNED